MLKKTEGIVLRTLKHQESNLITTIYTREYGLRSFILTGYRSARSRKRHSYFQPLSIIEVVYMERANRDLQKVSESKLSVLLHELQTHPIKLSLGLAIVEIFFDTVKEVEQNLPMYEQLRTVILALDKAPKRLIQLFIWFLLHHTRYLGFFPHDQSDGSRFASFDPKSGVFQAVPHDGDPVGQMLRYFVYVKPTLLPEADSCQNLRFDSNIKRHLIRTLFEYYEAHIDGFRYPQTMKVFAEVFGE
ncbi:MAG: DNA repair protein RecO [Bacteroidota bacterium]